MNKITGLLLCLAVSIQVSAAKYTLSGIVTDSRTAEAITPANIVIRPSGHAIATDADGRFSKTLENDKYTITISFVGYHPKTIQVNLDQDRFVKISLDERDNTLKEVVVTASESEGMTSSSRIDRSAMTHLQPTSFTDLLELLPGNISQTPDMGTVNSIKLRETGTLGASGQKTDDPDYDITSLGTLFVVDGTPINNDANMQNIPQFSSNNSNTFDFKKNTTNKGVDMRAISTDNIESVEIVRGIPSAEYGNLTSGLVNIRRIRHATPVTARFKADEYSKMFSIGKGFYLGNSGQILNIDGGYLDSKVDPRNNLENYKRVNLSTRFNLAFDRPALHIAWTPGLDYTGSFDNAKDDPDLSYSKINEYKSSYNRTTFTNDLTVTFKHLHWLKHLNLNASAGYQADRLERHKQVAPSRASVAPTSMSQGVHDGQYLLGEYIADYVSDGRPVNIFVKAKADGSLKSGAVTNRYKVGVEWSFSKNYGDGQIYDLTRPLSASWSTRPRAYKDIPALQVLSFFIEDNFSMQIGGNRLDLQAGLRTIQLPGINRRYALHGKAYLDPRINLVWKFPEFDVLNHSVKLLLAGGYGLTSKMPTVDYLYPQVHYNDIVQLNYYDVNRPLQYSRVNLRTYIIDAVNYDLHPARNRKWEIRLGAEYAGNRLSVTYFREKLTTGFRYTPVYDTYSYRKYDGSAIDPAALAGPPSLNDLPYTDERILDGFNKASNGSRIDKDGVEFQFNSARFRPIATALTITGAWFRSRYSNSQMLYATVSDVVDNKAVSDSYVGLYDYNDGRINSQFNTNFMFDTQITRWGLVFTTSIQCLWRVTTRRLWQNGVPSYYMSAADGKLHPYTSTSGQDPMLMHLVKTYNNDSFRPQSIPTAMYVNLKATKEIGRFLRIAVFANRLIDYLPDYKSNGLTVRRSSDPYFGMEINLTI